MKDNLLDISVSSNNKEQSSLTVDYLNQLLANYKVYQQNLQTFLWKNTGEKNIELHRKLEALQIDAEEKSKEIAERILALAHQPINLLATYLQLAEIKESQGMLEPNEMMINVLESHKILIKYFQKAIDVASKTEDITTVDMINRFMKNIEKSVDNM